MKQILIAVAAAIALGYPRMAAASEKIPVYINSTTEDTIGTTWVYNLREQLKASQTYEVVVKQSDAIFTINAVSQEDDKNISTMLAVVLTLQSDKPGWTYYVTQWVISCGRERIAQSVQNTIAAVDKQVNDFIKALQKHEDD